LPLAVTAWLGGKDSIKYTARCPAEDRVDRRLLMKNILAISLMAISLFAAANCRAAQGHSQIRNPGRGQGQSQDERAVSREPETNLRELKQDLPALLATARSAEKSGNWQEAALTYLRASILARKSGDLQNGLSYGESALRSGENAKLADVQVRAILGLAHNYSLVRQESRSGALLQRGLGDCQTDQRAAAPAIVGSQLVARNLKTITKVEALRQAQLNLIRGNINGDLLARRGIGGIGKLGEVPAAKPSADTISNSPLASLSTSHPYFWAPFILVGEGK